MGKAERVLASLNLLKLSPVICDPPPPLPLPHTHISPELPSLGDVGSPVSTGFSPVPLPALHGGHPLPRSLPSLLFTGDTPQSSQRDL